MTKTDSDALHEHLKSVCLFFADYAANLLACGAGGDPDRGLTALGRDCLSYTSPRPRDAS